MKAITICQRKGGNGKSTSCLNLARAFALENKRVLIIDLDDQKNSSSSIALKENVKYSVDSLLLDENVSVKETAVLTEWDGVSLIAGSANLSGAIRDLDSDVGSHLVLSEKLSCVKDFDICLIDTSPSLNILVVNALCASDFVFIPLSSKYFSLHGLTQTLDSVKKVQKRLKPSLQILGIAFVIFDGRSSLSKEVVSKTKEIYSELVCDVVINQNIKIEEAQVKKQSIFSYSPSDKGAVQYSKLACELLERMAVLENSFSNNKERP